MYDRHSHKINQKFALSWKNVNEYGTGLIYWYD